MMPGPQISIIVAIARNGVIGRNGTIPWHLPGDLPRFKRITMGYPVIMGRKTWESLRRPLPGRRNLVVTRTQGWQAQGAEAFDSLEAALAGCAGADQAFVIGGTEIIRAALPMAERLLLTEIDADFEGDTFFPAFDRSEWRETARETHAPSAAFAHRYDYVTYERVRSERKT